MFVKIGVRVILSFHLSHANYNNGSEMLFFHVHIFELVKYIHSFIHFKYLWFIDHYLCSVKKKSSSLPVYYWPWINISCHFNDLPTFDFVKICLRWSLEWGHKFYYYYILYISSLVYKNKYIYKNSNTICLNTCKTFYYFRFSQFI